MSGAETVHGQLFDATLDAAQKNKRDLLRISLSAAVPLWIIRLRGTDWTHIANRAERCAQQVAEHGDVILFRGKGTAEAFNALAEGLACAAFTPGGVRVFGMHFEAKLE